jgi:hypothetical protein
MTAKNRDRRTDRPAIDRHALVERHDVVLDAPHPEHVLTVGNGDFAFSADVTGMQTFTEYHDPVTAVRSGGAAINTATMTSWGWHEMPNPDGFVLDDAMTQYETSRGPVLYPDRHDMQAAMRGEVAEEYRAGAWLHANPQRVDLGRVGIELRADADGEVERDPAALTDVEQRLHLWSGLLESSFTYAGERVTVRTVAAPDDAVVAFRIESPLLRDGRARVTVRFPYASDGFFQTDDWDADDRHETGLVVHGPGRATVGRRLDDTTYAVELAAGRGAVEQDRPHGVTITAVDDVLELTVRWSPGAAADPAGSSPGGTLPRFDDVADGSATSWREFWTSGAALDLAGSTDPRAPELERRVVLSQYLTRVNCAGVMPPAETGLITNSWQGKAHLEMHFWHAAHFATWGRPELLGRSLEWYRTILPQAYATAVRQGYPGARWPKHVGPDGRESPDPIGSLLAWQQPHILYLLELVWRASDAARRTALLDQFGEIVHATATFMAAFPEERGDALHLGPPIMPAQEFYDARQTTDPTFELAYWWWGLEIAQRWRERAGHERHADWARVQDGLARPHTADGHYTAVASDEPMRRDDHPSLLAALGVVPSTPLVDHATMAATLADVLDDWQWPTAWGWDFAVMAMTATRLGRPDLAVDSLLRDEVKNRITAVGHNPQMGGILPLYLPGNGALLAAVSLMVTGADDGSPAGFPGEGWEVRAEGFVPWP